MRPQVQKESAEETVSGSGYTAAIIEYCAWDPTSLVRRICCKRCWFSACTKFCTSQAYDYTAPEMSLSCAAWDAASYGNLLSLWIHNDAWLFLNSCSLNGPRDDAHSARCCPARSFNAALSIDVGAFYRVTSRHHVTRLWCVCKQGR